MILFFDNFRKLGSNFGTISLLDSSLIFARNVLVLNVSASNLTPILKQFNN